MVVTAKQSVWTVAGGVAYLVRDGKDRKRE